MYTLEELEEGGVDGFSFEALLEVIEHVFGGLLEEHIILALPGIVDIVVAVESRHFAEGRVAVSPHHLAALPDHFGGRPGGLCLEH